MAHHQLDATIEVEDISSVSVILVNAMKPDMDLLASFKEEEDSKESIKKEEEEEDSVMSDEELRSKRRTLRRRRRRS